MSNVKQGSGIRLGLDERLVLTAAANHREDHQIRRRIKPFLRRTAGRFGCRFGGAAQMLQPSNIPQVLQANAGKSGDFLFCKDFLAEPDRWAAHV
jgi:hypothetical protein